MSPTLHAQILTLKKYQAWRTGKDARAMGEVGIKPAAITSALNAVIAIAEKHLRDGVNKAKCSEQPAKCSEVKGYDAADMASQGAQGFRDGYAAALEDAIAQCNALDNNENSERYRAGVLWCIERIKTLKTQQDGATRGYGADPAQLSGGARLTEELLRPKCSMCGGRQLFDGHCFCPRCNGTGIEPKAKP